jgi:membrane protein YqaA with SNARE-associated domain
MLRPKKLYLSSGMTHTLSRPNLIAFGWGLAEATVFFIVPDVYVGYRGLKGLRAALVASVWALAGALIGGTIMYTWASSDGVAALNLVRHVPAINPTVVQIAGSGYVRHGIWALFTGMTQGVPYKVFAVLAPARHIALPAFLLVSVFARACRFILVGLIVAGLSKCLSHWIGYRGRLGLYIVFWVIFYASYFMLHR